MNTIRKVTAWCAGFVLLFCVATISTAQTPAPFGWTGYAPGAVYGSTVPTITYAQAAPTVVYSTPPGTGWIGYAPNQGWIAYNPGVSWRYIDPNAGRAPIVTTRTLGPTDRAYGFRGPTTGSYREFGSGRSVPLYKPWLPGSR